MSDKKKKFKTGDRVQMSKKHLNWLCGWSEEGYLGGGNYSLSSSQYQDLAVLYLSREFNCPLRGTVTGDNGQRGECFAYRVAFTNKFGTYATSLYEPEALLRLKKAEPCPNCGYKK